MTKTLQLAPRLVKKMDVPTAIEGVIDAIVTDYLSHEKKHYETLREQGWRTSTEIAELCLNMSRDEMRAIRGMVEGILGKVCYIRAPKNIGTKSHIGSERDKFTPTQNIGGTLIKPDSDAWKDVEVYALRLQAENMKKVARALRVVTR